MKKLFYLLLFVGFTMYAQPTPTGPVSAGYFKMYVPELGVKADSVCVWNSSTKKIKFIPRSSFYQDINYIPLTGTEVGNDATGTFTYIGDDGETVVYLSGNGLLASSVPTLNYSFVNPGNISTNYSFGGNQEVHSLQINKLYHQQSDGVNSFDFTIGYPIATSTASYDLIQPRASGVYVASVNGVSADEFGNVVVSTIIGNAATATALQTSRTIGIFMGDASSPGSSFDGTANNSNTLTLATVNSDVGTFGSATQVPVFTVNGKGLITGVTNTSIALPQSAITNLVTDLAAKQATISLTPAGTSGAATFSANNINIPRYDTYADTKVADVINDGTTDTAPSQNAVADALKGYTKVVAKSTVATTPVTLTILESIAFAEPISAGEFAAGNVMRIWASVSKTGVLGTSQFKLYVNTSASLSGATLIGASQASANVNLGYAFQRHINCRASNTIEFFDTGSLVMYENASATGPRDSATFTYTGAFYVIGTITNGNSADSTVIATYTIERL
jgi:hypothetical protein